MPLYIHHKTADDSAFSGVRMKERKRERPQWREAVAGAFAGALSRTAMAPVERVKLLLQLQHQAQELVVNSQKSALQVARDVYHKEGFLSFWRGNLPNVWRTAGTAAINFTCMDYYKRVAVGPWLESSVLQRKNTSTAVLERRRNLLASLVSGGLAGGTATTILYPLEFARTRLAMDLGRTNAQRRYTGLVDVSKQIYKMDGIRGFYQGYGIALFGGIFYRILFLGGYDALKAELRFRKDRRLSWWERYVAAQTISLTAGTLSYPLDSVRRRLMMQAGVNLSERKYAGSLDCLRKVAVEEGIRGFYLGLTPNLVRSLGGALLLVAYDSIRAFL